MASYYDFHCSPLLPCLGFIAIYYCLQYSTYVSLNAGNQFITPCDFAWQPWLELPPYLSRCAYSLHDLALVPTWLGKFAMHYCCKLQIILRALEPACRFLHPERAWEYKRVEKRGDDVQSRPQPIVRRPDSAVSHCNIAAIQNAYL